MYAVTVTVEINDQSEATRQLHEQVVPTVSQAPGFVAGYWQVLEDRRGMGFLVFESQDAANAAAEGARGSTEGPAPVADVQVREIVAHA
jgi:hypothetical protein